MTIEDESVFIQCAEDEMTEPCPRKRVGDRYIYRTRKLPRPRKWGSPVLTDLGEARAGPQVYRHIVQPELYRAPEILLRMDWDHKVCCFLCF